MPIMKKSLNITRSLCLEPLEVRQLLSVNLTCEPTSLTEAVVEETAFVASSDSAMLDVEMEFPELTAKADFTVTTEAELKDALSLATNGERIILDADINLNASISVVKTTDCTLDLNGHILNGSRISEPVSAGDRGAVITNSGTLTIMDSDPTATHEGMQIKGGIITGGKGYNPGKGNVCGGGIYNTGTLMVWAVTITGNSASTNGGGIYNSGTLTLNACTINGNTANVNGGAIYSTGTLTVHATTICGNSAGENGGGVYVNAEKTAISGTTRITENTRDGGAASNLFLATGRKISMDLSTGTLIGVSVVTGGAFTTNGKKKDVSYFTSDCESGEVSFLTDHLELTAKEEVTVRTEAELNEALALAVDGEKITVAANLCLQSSIIVAKATDCVLDLNGHILDASQIDGEDASRPQSATVITNFGKLKLIDGDPNTTHEETEICGAILMGGRGYRTNAGTVGGGLYNAGTLSIYGCTVTDCHADFGGGVGSDGKGSLSLNGSCITGNTSSSNGAGVYLNSIKTTIGGSVRITENTLLDGSMSNLWLENGKTLTFSENGLAKDAKIGVALGNQTGMFAVNAKEGDELYFTSDCGGLRVLFNSDSHTLQVVRSSYSITPYIGLYDGQDHPALTIQPLEEGEIATYFVEGKELQEIPRFSRPGTYAISVVICRNGEMVYTRSFVSKITLSLEVTTLGDVYDPNDGVLSLREAIVYANDCQADGQTITFTDDLCGKITLTSDLPEIRRSFGLNGNGRITLDGSGQFHLLSITGEDVSQNSSAESPILITGLTLTAAKGVALLASDCELEVVNSTFTGNPDGAIALGAETSATFVNNTLVGNSVGTFIPVIVSSDSGNIIHAFNTLVVGNGSGSAEEQIQGVSLSPDDGNLLSMATDEIFANPLPSVGESWADWKPALKQTSEASAGGVLTPSVNAAFGVQNDSDWDDVCDNYGNSRTTVKNEIRTINIGSCEESVQNRLTIVQDGNYVLITLQCSIDDSASYVFAFKSSSLSDRPGNWRTAQMMVVQLDDGSFALQAWVKKSLFKNASVRDYKVEVTKAGESRLLLTGLLTLKGTATPKVRIKALGVKSFQITFKGGLSGEMEARTVLKSRVRNDGKWSDWSGDIRLSDLLEVGYVTKTGDGVYLFDYSEQPEISAGASLRVKVWFDCNVVVNSFVEAEVEHSTFYFASAISTNSVTLKQPSQLPKVCASASALSENTILVIFQKVDSRTTEIRYQYCEGSGLWSDWVTLPYVPGLTESFEITDLTGEAPVKIRLVAATPNNIEVKESPMKSLKVKSF